MPNGNLQKKNAKKIDNAFDRILKQKDNLTENAMVKCLEKAYQFAMQLHEYGHKNLHFITGGDYGWILIHNGEVMRKFINEGQNSVGNVDSRLNAIAGRSRKTGWVGIVMAGMKGAHYSTGFEKEVIKSAANMTKDEFLRLFKLVRLK